MPYIDEIPQWRLLMRVCPLFESNLVWTAQHQQAGHEIIVDGYADLFRVNLQSLKMIVPTEKMLAEDEYYGFIGIIDSLLLTLESLLLQTIITTFPADVSALKKIAKESRAPGLFDRCLKLLVLERLIQKMTISELALFVSLEQEPLVLKQKSFEVQSFNSAVRSILRPNSRASMLPTSAEYRSRMSNSLIKSSYRLFHMLAVSVQHCTLRSLNHESMLHLNYIEHLEDSVSNPKLCLRFGACAEKRIWQQTIYTELPDTCEEHYHRCSTNTEPRLLAYRDDEKDQGEQKERVLDACFQARIAHKNGHILQLQLIGETLFDSSDPTSRSESEKTVSSTSLRNLLELGLLKERYTFCPNDKKILAYTLSHALVNFYGSPWLQRLWTLENIRFLYSHTDQGIRIHNVHQPYVSCIISTDVPPLGELDVLHNNPLIFSFAKLLIELETGEEVKPKRLNRKGQPSLYWTLRDFCHNSSMHQLSPGYRNALDACMRFSTICIEERKQNPTMTDQQVIFKYIVQQLERDLHPSQRMTWGTRDLELKPRELSNGVLLAEALAVERSKSRFPDRTLADDITPSNIFTKENKLRFEDYTVAILCASEFEMSAVRAMLDGENPNLSKHPNDFNNYVLGQLKGETMLHNVVLACLPGTQGKGAAATVATHLERTFTCLRSRFLTGVGGGVPGLNNDIRLGDIVIGMPEEDHGGVVQFDMGEDTDDGFRQKGFLTPAPPHLRSIVNRMRSDHRIGDSKVQSFVASMLECMRRRQDYEKPPAESDVLSQADYPLIQGPAYIKCGKSGLYQRPARLYEGPEIHYGLIASGDHVIRSATTRDVVIKHVGNVLCFEMEAAGLATNFPYIVVRGISNYGSSDKDDSWRNYAAATAAACTKELISYL